MSVFDGLKVQCAAAVALRREFNRLDQERNHFLLLLRTAENNFATGLKGWILREAQAVLNRGYPSRCVQVRVHCLVNHRNYTGTAFVTIMWAGLFGRFEFEELVTDGASMKRLLRRFEKTVRINSMKSGKQEVAP